jgi:hypothetical protein
MYNAAGHWSAVHRKLANHLGDIIFTVLRLRPADGNDVYPLPIKLRPHTRNRGQDGQQATTHCEDEL